MSGATTAVGRVHPPSRARQFIRRLTSGDEIAHLITLTFGASILLITGLLVLELWVQSSLARHQFGLEGGHSGIAAAESQIAYAQTDERQTAQRNRSHG